MNNGEGRDPGTASQGACEICGKKWRVEGGSLTIRSHVTKSDLERISSHIFKKERGKKESGFRREGGEC